jgi:hypothetical protein
MRSDPSGKHAAADEQRRTTGRKPAVARSSATMIRRG